MLENGWVKVHRSFLKWEWYDDVNTKVVFLHLMLTVNVEDACWHGIEVKRGSRITSYAKLANETGLSVRAIRTAIEHLELTGEVTRSPHSKYTVISLNQYAKYQDATSTSTSVPQDSDKDATSQRQGNDNKVIKYKKAKNDEKCSHTHHTPQEICSLVSGMGYRWSDEEIEDFIAYNEERGWKLSPETAAQKWEKQRQKQLPPRKSQDPYDGMTEKECKNLEAYAALSNRFRF